MRGLALLAVLAASPVAAGSADLEQARVAERLAARAQETLDGILGPGRSKVQIDVAGEHSEIQSDAEFLFPMSVEAIKKSRASYLLDLPGYVKSREAAGAPGKAGKAPVVSPGSQVFNKEHEASTRDSGFQVRSIRATVLLDSRLDDAAVRDVAQLLPQLLNLDTGRGDVLSILRAPLRPAWRSAFSTPADWRAAAYAAQAGLVALLAALILGGGLVWSGRSLGLALGRELAAPRAPAAAPPSATAEALPELAPGAGGYLAAEAPSPALPPASGAILLGRRFDFLAGGDADLLARALAAETPEDLAVFFGHLTESIPDLASRLFTQLSWDLQGRVSERLMTLRVADPDRLAALEERLREALENGVRGPESLGKLLSRVPGEERSAILDRLAVHDAAAAKELERSLFSFDDLETLDGASRRRLLEAVPYETWGPALRGARPALADLVLSDMPPDPRERVRAVAAAPQPREKIAEARSRILDALAALAAKGELTLGRAETGGDLV